jgi:hypothetical protein
MRFDCAVCERHGGVDAPADDALDELVCGDHAMRDVRVSWLDGIGMLRTTSNVDRHRIWRRAPARHAMCDAVGDGTESDDATAC